jgi:hypothetical protein
MRLGLWRVTPPGKRHRHGWDIGPITPVKGYRKVWGIGRRGTGASRHGDRWGMGSRVLIVRNVIKGDLRRSVTL